MYAADSQVLLARLRAGTPLTDCPAEAAGVRSLWRPQALAPAFRPFDSAAAMPDARELILRRLAENGVTVVDPAATYVDPRCSVAPGVTLLPGTILRGHTAVDRDSEIGPNSMLRDCRIGQRTTVNASQLNASTVDDGTNSMTAPWEATPPWGPSPMCGRGAPSATTAGWGTLWR